MKHTVYNRNARIVGLAALATTMTWAATMPVSAQTRPRAGTTNGTRASRNATRTVTLDAGTVIPVRLEDTLSSKDNRQGDTFTAKVRVEDEGDYSGIPEGTTVEGRILTARAQKDKEPGVLEVGFQRLRFPNGRSYPITGSLIGLDNKSVTKTRDGRLVAKPGAKNNRLTYAGYGAAGGAVIGLLTGGKLRLENVLLGGALGYLFGTTEKAKEEVRDVSLKPGTEMGVRLDRSLTYSSLDNDDEYDSRSDAARREDRERFYRRDRSRDTDDTTALDRSRRDRDNRDRDDSVPARDRVNATDIGVLVDDRNVRFDSNARPVLTKGLVLVPIRPMMNAARVNYTYDAQKQEVRAMGPDGTVRLGINSRVAVMNGDQRIRLDAPAQRLNGTIYVPLKFIELATGQKATWDASSRTVVLSAPDQEDRLNDPIR